MSNLFIALAVALQLLLAAQSPSATREQKIQALSFAQTVLAEAQSSAATTTPVVVPSTPPRPLILGRCANQIQWFDGIDCKNKVIVKLNIIASARMEFFGINRDDPFRYRIKSTQDKDMAILENGIANRFTVNHTETKVGDNLHIFSVEGADPWVIHYYRITLVGSDGTEYPENWSYYHTF